MRSYRDSGRFRRFQKRLRGRYAGSAHRLYFGEHHPLTADMLGADEAALTLGYEPGYIPAAVLVHIIRLVSHNREITLRKAVLDARVAMEILFAGRKHLPAFLQRIDQAVTLSETYGDDLTAIHALGCAGGGVRKRSSP